MNSTNKYIELNDLPARLACFPYGTGVVLANGAFDIFHVGHLRYLMDAAALGDVLIVAINDDASVQRLKGKNRPVFPLDERVELIAALPFVTFVTSFSEDSVKNVIKLIKPRIHAKGTDYTPETVPECEEVHSYGGKIVICGDQKKNSTTEIINKIGSRINEQK